MASQDRGSRDQRKSGPSGSTAPKRSGYAGRDNARRDDAPSRRDGAPARRDGKPSARDGAGRKPYGARSDRPNSGERRPRTDKPVKKGPPAPEIPEEVVYGQLDRTVRARLRTLSKENAEDVGRHLIMAGNLIDTDPELAYRHAAVAAARGGRVDVVREAAALTAYATGRYAEALREFRTVRRLNGSSEHLPLMADCERGLGRPERAIALAQEPEAGALPPAGRVELAIVVAGARSDMGDDEAALVALKRLTTNDPEVRERIDEATAEVLRALGRNDEADALTPQQAVNAPDPFADEDVIVYDTFEDESPKEGEQQ